MKIVGISANKIKELLRSVEYKRVVIRNKGVIFFNNLGLLV